MRVVLDTSVLVSAFIRPQGSTGQVLHQLRAGLFTAVYSVPLLFELVDVLSRPLMVRKYGVEADDITALINLIRLRGELVDPQRPVRACRDPRDDKFLEAAVAGEAQAIVSGDADLLEMGSFESIPILGVAEFLARL